MAGIAAIATVFLGVTPAAFSITSKGMYYFGWLFLSLCSGGIILALALNSGGVIESLLENPWFVYTGKLSYSLYLWHYPVIRVCNERKLSHQQTIFFGLCATISLAMASYYLIERPCLRLKQRFARIKQTS